MSTGRFLILASVVWAVFTVWAYRATIYGGYVALGVALTALTFAAGVTLLTEGSDRLPGALAAEDRAGFDAGLRAQRTQGMGVLGVEAVEPDPVTPVYEGTVIDWLERSYSWPEVFDFDEWPGDVG